MRTKKELTKSQWRLIIWSIFIVSMSGMCIGKHWIDKWYGMYIILVLGIIVIFSLTAITALEDTGQGGDNGDHPGGGL